MHIPDYLDELNNIERDYKVRYRAILRHAWILGLLEKPLEKIPAAKHGYAFIGQRGITIELYLGKDDTLKDLAPLLEVFTEWKAESKKDNAFRYTFTQGEEEAGTWLRVNISVYPSVDGSVCRQVVKRRHGHYVEDCEYEVICNA